MTSNERMELDAITGRLDVLAGRLEAANQAEAAEQARRCVKDLMRMTIPRTTRMRERVLRDRL